MFGWLKRKPRPLRGAPPLRRQKTYSAASGYVYQYYFEGYRDASRGGEAGVEYVFAVSADRRNAFPASVFLLHSALAVWETGHVRALESNERYAIAKMALFLAFDEREDPDALKEPILLRPADVAAILETLGIE